MGGIESYIDYWWEGQREFPLGRPRNGWVENIKIDILEV
jgi:hypothetical protein